MSEFTFISPEWLKPLLKKLVSLEKKSAIDISNGKAREVNEIRELFDSPSELVRCYVEPYCQEYDPGDYPFERPTISPVRAPIFSSINALLKADFPLLASSGNRWIFLLAGSGMGKTSLLVMIKLAHLMGFWSQEYDCLLLKLGEDSLDTIGQHQNKTNTVLLLDALDEDSLAWGNIEGRLLEILAATKGYYRVIISSRTQSLLSTAMYFPDQPGRIRIGEHVCPSIFLTSFDHRQVSDYLTKRFPNHPCDIFFHCSDSMRQRAQHLVGEMDPLNFPPLLLSHAHDILAAKSRDADPYSLYRGLFEAWLAREEAELRKLPRKKLAEPPSRNDLWEIFITIAVFLQQRGGHVLSHANLYKLEKDLPILASLAHVDTGERSLLKRNAAGDLRFSHHAIQEFLVVHGILHGQTDIINDAIRVTDQLSMFLKAANITDLSLPKRLDSGQSFSPVPEFHFYDQLADGASGPAMQPIPAGEFLMGAPKTTGDKNEHPQHHVRIATPFALGTWLVTFDEFDRFCAATGRQKPSDQGWGRKRRPVINVSWQDAVDYCAWLSRQTGHHYRLPSEAEWEYAARAGTRTQYWWGDEFDDASRANCDHGGIESDIRHTSPVGSFPSNPFGLYDTAGNVWEWTADCWHDNYQNAPPDETVWSEKELGHCTHRVVRGGSWNNDPKELRSSSRDRYPASGVTYGLLGFRLAREF
uniref:Formylglycine-generating enzyme, required for sulfatase activity, contains SUMF1/FGE domain n=1 Tax=Candidatus Kentrum sp. FW TaxID=2126338 RepID=A0A450TZQ2_9GAMM|nr:MAG: Formylglycine-generating enzyme, required for sulfatase activity, contains SUMF1/FGE domain [Candidatus Kentron sp. FW]